jgi:hypothetical protein
MWEVWPRKVYRGSRPYRPISNLKKYSTNVYDFPTTKGFVKLNKKKMRKPYKLGVENAMNKYVKLLP